MEESILESIKRALGFTKEYTYFDQDVLMNINSVCMVLTQLGVGPPDGFFVSGYDQTWADYLTNGKQLMAVRTYIYIKVRLVIDPPSSSFVLEALKKNADELEWRLQIKAENDRKEAENINE